MSYDQHPVPYRDSAPPYEDRTPYPYPYPSALLPGAEPVVAPARRRRLRLLPVVGVVGVLAAGGLGVLAWHEQQVAGQWKSLERRQAAAATFSAGQLTVANHRLSALDGQVQTMSGQLSSLQGQLSSVADQKEKAVDQEAVLQQLLGAAANVTTDLQNCIDATTSFETSLNSAVGSLDLGSFTSLQDQASAATRTCTQAETADADLQSAIQSAP